MRWGWSNVPLADRGCGAPSKCFLSLGFSQPFLLPKPQTLNLHGRLRRQRESELAVDLRCFGNGTSWESWKWWRCANRTTNGERRAIAGSRGGLTALPGVRFL